MRIKTQRSHFIAYPALAVLGLASLSGCSAMMLDPAAIGIFRRDDTRMIERNTAAADYMAHQAESFIKTGDIIRASALTDPQEQDLTAPIGRNISEDVGLRLIQLGYTVDLRGVSDAQNPSGYADQPQSAGKADFILGGTYRRERGDLRVSLRVTQTATGRVVAGFDYNLPYTKEVGTQSTPKAKIYRTDNGVPTDMPAATTEPVTIEKLP